MKTEEQIRELLQPFIGGDDEADWLYDVIETRLAHWQHTEPEMHRVASPRTVAFFAVDRVREELARVLETRLSDERPSNDNEAVCETCGKPCVRITTKTWGHVGTALNEGEPHRVKPVSTPPRSQEDGGATAVCARCGDRRMDTSPYQRNGETLFWCIPQNDNDFPHEFVPVEGSQERSETGGDAVDDARQEVIKAAAGITVAALNGPHGAVHEPEYLALLSALDTYASAIARDAEERARAGRIEWARAVELESQRATRAEERATQAEGQREALEIQLAEARQEIERIRGGR